MLQRPTKNRYFLSDSKKKEKEKSTLDTYYMYTVQSQASTGAIPLNV